MNEENKFGPKRRWTRIFRKKWFFPSVYLVLAALLISAVFWYQNSGDEEIADDVQETEDYTPVLNEEEPAEPVMGEQEEVSFPVANPEDAQIVTKFFDYNADEAEQVNALIHYNNRYYQSTGVDFAREDGESFEVLASLSGTVSEVKEDPLLGNVVIIEHSDDVKTFYASLGEVAVQADDEVAQGEVLGTAGTSNFGKDKGTHVHFEIRKNDVAVNPESVFNQPLSVIETLTGTAEEEVDADSEADTETETDAEADEADYADEADETEEAEPGETADEEAEDEADESDDLDAEQEEDVITDEEQDETEEDTEE